MLLVFLRFVLIGETSLSIIAIFIIIIICNFRKKIFKVFKPYVVTSSRRTKAEVFLFVFFLLKPLFKLFLNFFKRLYIIEKIIYRLKLLKFYKFFNLGIFYGSVLELYLGYNNMSKMMASRNLMIYLLNIRSKLITYFGFNI